MTSPRSLLNKIITKADRLKNLVRISLSDCVNIGGYSYGKGGNHPFLQVLSDFDKGRGLDHKTSSLVEFYRNNTLATFQNLIYEHDESEGLEGVYSPPWGGGKKINVRNDFEHWIGPKTNDEIDTFLKYFYTLYKKFKSEKYNPFFVWEGFIRVHQFIGDSKVKYLIIGGQKRSSIFSYYGYEKVLALLQPKCESFPGNMPAVIRLKDVDRWPNVLNRKYTKDEAIDFFNIYMK